ncbi:MAG TPA: DLW-39 family protein [Actinomycetaceae bacterium]|uniref:DLW-39 family protein n=1 Tax=Ruania albidiflava TaxID=366586 RepID=UPI002BEEA00F|nr:DLW-39 family protein [Actinomycetaceae bacterium]
MRKILGLAVLAAAGYAVWSKVKADREERALWAEVTDSFGGNTFPEAPAAAQDTTTS